MNLLTNQTDFEQAWGTADITSKPMKTAISDWYDLYYNQNVPEKENSCQRIAYTIVRKIAKAIFSEYKATSKQESIQDTLYSLDDVRNEAIQQMLIAGECFLKPIPEEGKFSFGVIPRQNFMVFGRDPKGYATDIGSIECTTKGNQYYTLLERRTAGENDTLTITYQLYKSGSKDQLGQKVPLASLDRYADLPEEMVFNNIPGVGLAQLRAPISNCVDGSHDGVSVYAAATDLIHDINRNEYQLCNEFENGQSRIIASSDMVQKDSSGKCKGLDDNLFIGLDEDPDNVGITTFSPPLREESYNARKTEYLRNVESVIGLKRGLLSEVEATERTATEVTSSEGDYALTVQDFQKEWEDTIWYLFDLCAKFGVIYKINLPKELSDNDLVIEWGNGVLYDPDADWAVMMDLVSRGMLMPEIPLGKRYNLPYETESQRKKIRDMYMPKTQLGDE